MKNCRLFSVLAVGQTELMITCYRKPTFHYKSGRKSVQGPLFWQVRTSSVSFVVHALLFLNPFWRSDLKCTHHEPKTVFHDSYSGFKHTPELTAITWTFHSNQSVTW
jgi:hypothetical protein